MQVRANSKELLAKSFDVSGIVHPDREQIMALFDEAKMSESQIRETCVAIRPYMGELFAMWSESSMKNFTLTSVGMAIAHANIKRLIPEFAALSTWIN